MSSRRTKGQALYSLHFWIFFILSCGTAIGRTGSPRWWNIIQQLSITPMNGTLTISTKGKPFSCSRIPGLVPQQIRFCKKYKDLMLPIAYGTHLGLEQCKEQFKGRRWNCSTMVDGGNTRATKALRRKGILGGVLETGSRETAFVHAIAAAGLVYSVAKFCNSAGNSFQYCGCDDSARDFNAELLKNHKFRAVKWRWGSCNENTHFGAFVANNFAGAGERGRSARVLMNTHNNKAGIKAIRSNVIIKCKCHGLSGSCELETCWWAMKNFKEIGSKLKDKYDGASEMKIITSRGVAHKLIPVFQSVTPPKEDDLVYYEQPPDFCERNTTVGIFGTIGRVCNATSTGIDGCDLLCCGRGYHTRSRSKTVKCQCVFHWCCTVTCKSCVVKYKENICL